jgi:hypothetical protein
MNKIIFPQFRRYKNVETYFKIESLDSFEEIRSLGEKWIIEIHTVKILPDRNLVHDLLHNFSDFAEEISPETYLSVKENALKNGL